MRKEFYVFLIANNDNWTEKDLQNFRGGKVDVKLRRDPHQFRSGRPLEYIEIFILRPLWRTLLYPQLVLVTFDWKSKLRRYLPTSSALTQISSLLMDKWLIFKRCSFPFLEVLRNRVDKKFLQKWLDHFRYQTPNKHLFCLKASKNDELFEILQFKNYNSMLLSLNRRGNIWAAINVLEKQLDPRIDEFRNTFSPSITPAPWPYNIWQLQGITDWCPRNEIRACSER